MTEHRTTGSGPQDVRHGGPPLGPEGRAAGKTVDFVRLLARSSLGTPAAQRDRAIGNRELAAHHAQERARSGPRTAATHPASLDDDLAIAAELELRGYTFEAELHYRRLLDDPVAAGRLALLLEAKGRGPESWQHYVQAASAHDTNSLFRLAVICRRRGETAWARELLDHASATLPEETVARVACNARELVGGTSRRVPGELRANPSLDGHVDATFALGSMLFVASDRADLARLAYSSALARGHGGSAMSLLDMAGPVPGPMGSAALSQELRKNFAANRYPESGGSRRARELREHLLRARDALGGSDCAGLTLGVGTCGGGTAEEGALRRWGQIARLITVLHGLRKLGADGAALTAIESAAAEVGRGVLRRLAAARSPVDWADLVRAIWESGDRALDGKRPLLDPVRARLDADRRVRPGSGVVHRLHREFARLRIADVKVLVLSLAGLTDSEVAEVVGPDAMRRPEASLPLLRERLVLAQRGEEHGGSHELLWAEVETALTASPP